MLGFRFRFEIVYEKNVRRQLTDRFTLFEVILFLPDNLIGLKKITFRPANKTDSVVITHFKIQT